MVAQNVLFFTGHDVMNPSKQRNCQELHIAVVGANQSGKSALTVKYMTRRYISEYDPNIEDTYCKHETINGHECMLWIMDTVEGPDRDPNRYLPWADVHLVVYSITNKTSFEYAEKLLRNIIQHDHSMCIRPHLTFLIGNKTDLDRYRQVSKSQGILLASTYGAEFFETNTTEEYSLVKCIFHHAVDEALSRRNPSTSGSSDGIQRLVKLHELNGQHSPSPSQSRSDPEQLPASPSGTLDPKRTMASISSPKSTLPRRSKSPSARLHDVVFPRDKNHQQQHQTQTQEQTRVSNPLPQKKSSSALKLLKLLK